MKKAGVFFLFLLILSLDVFAQNWQDKHQMATSLYHSGDYAEAMDMALENLPSIRKQESVESQAYARGLRLLSLIAYSRAMYAQGIDYARQEVKLWEHLGLPDTSAYAESLYNLGMCQLRMKKSEESIHTLEKALSLSVAVVGQEHMIRNRLLLGKAYFQQGDLAGARTLLAKVQEDLQKMQGEAFLEAIAHYLAYQLENDDSADRQLKLKLAYAALRQEKIATEDVPEYADMLEVLAHHYQDEQQFDQARSLYRKLNELYEQKLLKDSLRWSGILNNLGVISAKINPKASGHWLQKAFQIQKARNETGGDAFWASLDNYAMALHREGKTQQALSLYEQYSDRLTSPDALCNSLVVAINNFAFLLRQLDRKEEAISVLNQADQLLGQKLSALDRKQQLHLTTLYFNLAQTHQSLSQYDSAIFYYKRSTEIAKLAQATQSAEYLAAINGMAGLYHDIGYYTEAEIFYGEALRIQELLGGRISNTYASIQSNFALLYQDRGAYREAIGLLEEALETKRKLLGLDHPDYIAVLANLGLLYMEQADYQAARRILETVLIKYENLYGKQHPRLAYSLTNLARLELAMGNYPEAEPLLKQALQIQESLYGRQHPAYAVTAVELGNFYMLLGNYEAAAPLLQHSRQLLKERYGDKHPAYATATQNLAVLAEAQGELAKAETFLLETLEIDRHTLGKQNPKYALTLNNLASFYQNNDSLQKAMPLLEEALAISQNVLGKQHPLYTSTLFNLALLYQDLQAFRQAEPLIAEVLQVRKDLLGEKHPDYAYALFARAVNAYRLGAYDQAISLFESVTELYAWQIKEYFPALSEKEKSAFYQRIEPVMNTYRDFVITMNLQEGSVDEADKKRLRCSLYNVQLLTKAMLLDASNKIRRSIFQSGNSELIGLYEEWQGRKEQLAKYYTLSEQELAGQDIQLQELENEANELEKQLADRSRIFARSLVNRELSWLDIRNQLKQDEAAVEIIRVEDEDNDQVFYTALIVEAARDAPGMVILPDGSAMDAKNYNYYKNAVAFRIEDELSYSLYWKPIGDALSPGIHTVYVAPDGVYNKISLNCLYNTRDETYLLDEINLRMLSSTRELTDTRPDAMESGARPFAFLVGYPDYTFSGDQTFLAEAQQFSMDAGLPVNLNGQMHDDSGQSYDFQPLPGTKQEVDYIASMMEKHDWYIEKLTGSRATEENLKQMIMPQVLHIATHGYFFSDLSAGEDEKTFGIHMQNIEANPLLRSGLLLAGAARNQSHADSMNLASEDGVLTAYEAMNLNLNRTELVVLSACETALGEVRNGEGVYGLQRAFLVAGAKSVLMSLWKVNDESTRQLIQLFYDNWLSGQDKFTALANAQRKIREKYEEPYHWAPFVLIGI